MRGFSPNFKDRFNSSRSRAVSIMGSIRNGCCHDNAFNIFSVLNYILRCALYFTHLVVPAGTAV